GWVGKGNQRELVLEDEAEQRFICRDRPQPPPFPAVEALAEAVRQASPQLVVLARLMVRPGQTRILAHALSLLDDRALTRLTVEAVAVSRDSTHRHEKGRQLVSQLRPLLPVIEGACLRLLRSGS